MLNKLGTVGIEEASSTLLSATDSFVKSRQVKTEMEN